MEWAEIQWVYVVAEGDGSGTRFRVFIDESEARACLQEHPRKRRLMSCNVYVARGGGISTSNVVADYRIKR